ncbi:unnamed protein product [Lymnaea stagnalis]|uniref:Glycoprotein-N-acetylgalactosamine 3-beta-galactosyltransferase 1 n=1 Tax=Lymnaea stagnalis TaxID=6523 RepID=A0AAV2HGH2_LYMST
MIKQSFSLGVCLGLSMTVIIQVFDVTGTFKDFYIRHISPQSWNNTPYIACRQVTSNTENPSKETEETLKGSWLPGFDVGSSHKDDDVIAISLFKTVRVACWILTSPSNLEKKAIHVKNTWAKRCNVVVFISSQRNDSFPTVGVNASEGREHLTAKTMQAFKYLYDHNLNDADWFLKADDDTYVIMENLRYFLSAEDPQKPVYFGQRFKPHVKQGYASGGAGYVISKEALRRYGQRGSQNVSMCKNDLGDEDVEFGRCLQNLGVILKTGLDAQNRTRFHCWAPEFAVRPEFTKALLEYDFENGTGFPQGIENISDYAISFHYVSPTKMYDMEFFIYHLRRYGVLNMPQKLNVVT